MVLRFGEFVFVIHKAIIPSLLNGLLRPDSCFVSLLQPDSLMLCFSFYNTHIADAIPELTRHVYILV